MNCKLCKKLKLKKLRRLNKAIERGSLNIEDLADKFNLPPSLVLYHYNSCLGGAPKVHPHSSAETLQTILNVLLEDLESARNEYYDGGEDADRTGAAIFYNNLVREVREYAASIEKLRPTDALVDAVHNQVLAPMLGTLAKILVEEGAIFDSELRDLLGTGYDPKVNSLIKETWKKISTRFFVLEASPDKLKPKLTGVIAEENAVGKKKPQRKTAASTRESKTIH